MCGIFGYVGDNLNLETLQSVAKTTEQRGPHAFGFAWVDVDNRLHSFKQTGRISDHLGLLRMARHATMLIGHCRYATHGSPEENINNHPHPCDGGWVVHNGVVRNYFDLVEKYNMNPTSECDSEVIALMIEQGTGSIIDRCKRAGQQLHPSSQQVVLGLWSHPRRLIAMRCGSGNPINMGVTSGGYYLGSYSDHLPGLKRSLPGNRIMQFAPKKEGYNVNVCSI